MRILFLAPQPFFIERGTPIAVKLALEVLGSSDTAQPETHRQVDLLTYHLGGEISLPGVRHFRIPAIPFIHGVGSGISIKKLICDLFFTAKALSMALRGRKDYHLVHAVEESVFIALLIKLFFGIPYVYDMDSSMVDQLVEKWPLLWPLKPLFNLFERTAVRHSIAVVPVCDSLAEIAAHHGSREISVLRDISLLSDNGAHTETPLRVELGLPPSTELVVYIGNLERYQGIDLLLQSFRILAERHSRCHLLIIGGSDTHLRYYRLMAESLTIASRVHFLGPRPLAALNRFYGEADILVSPRINGTNTPMKIYSYLHSGRAIVATNLRTHSQVLTPSVALLSPPEEKAFAASLLELLEKPELRQTLGAAAKKLADENFTFDVFRDRLNEAYAKIHRQVCAPQN